MSDGQVYKQNNWRRMRALRNMYWITVRKLMAAGIVRIRNGHYYSPVPSVKELERDAERIFDRYLRVLPGIDLDVPGQLALLQRLSKFYGEQPFEDGPQDGLRYFFDNDWFNQTDALVLYGLIRHFRPRRIIEIGSGFSSAVMLDTNELFMDRGIQLTFIEPDCSRLSRLIRPADRDSTEIIEKRIQDLDPGIVDALEHGDFLFIDSSHVSKAGSDVNHILFELLPRLAPGVLVHFHDILYPFEYTLEWFKQGLSWNEPYILRAFLQYNARFSIYFWNDFMTSFHNDEVKARMPLCAVPRGYGIGGSLWLQKTDPDSPRT